MTTFCWINTVLCNVKISFSGALHVLCFNKHSDHYFGACSFRFNRRYGLGAIIDRVLCAVRKCMERPEWLLRRMEHIA